MAKVVTMGEIMLRLSTPGNQKYIQATQFDINYGGGEANVAVSLANYGHDAEFVTKVPENPIGACAVAAALRKYGVETKHIAKGGDRLGIYFLETGASMRPSNVHMTELTHQSQQQAFLILILTKSLKVLIGSTSQVLHLLFQTLPLNLQRLLVKLLRLTV